MMDEKATTRSNSESRNEGLGSKKVIWPILLIVVTEALGYALILPFFPYLAEDLGASPLLIGLILSSFSFFQLLSSPVFGKLSDRYGRKPILIFSQFTTFLGFFILGIANSVWLLFLSRMVDGLFGSNRTVCQAYLTDISDEKNRSKVFALEGMAISVGILVGPALGGILAKWGYSVPAFLAAGICVFTILLVIFVVPESLKNKDSEIKISASEIFPFREIGNYLRMEETRLLLAQMAFFALSFFAFTSTISLYTRRQLGLDTAELGIALLYLMVLRIGFQAALIRKLIQYGETKLKMIGIILIISGFSGLLFVNSVLTYILSLTLIAIGSALTNPIILSDLSKAVSEKEKGRIMGITNSLDSFAQIVSPIIGGFILETMIPGVLGIATALFMVPALLIQLRLRSSPKKSLK